MLEQRVPKLPRPRSPGVSYFTTFAPPSPSLPLSGPHVSTGARPSCPSPHAHPPASPIRPRALSSGRIPVPGASRRPPSQRGVLYSLSARVFDGLRDSRPFILYGDPQPSCPPGFPRGLTGVECHSRGTGRRLLPQLVTFTLAAR